MEKVSIVIPCYNSENTITYVVDEIIAIIQEEIDFEIILVNDGSTLELWNVIIGIVNKYQGKVKGISLAKNFGQHAALMAGYRVAKGDIIIQMDDDGQCNPVGILPLIDKIKEGYDVAYAKYPEEKKTKLRSIGSEFNRRMCISLINMPGDIHPTSFAAYKRFIVEEMVRYDKPYPYIGGLVFRSTTNICNVEVEHRKRMSGKSNYKLKTLFKLWLNGFTAFSVKPLEIASLSGVGIAFVGIVYAGFIIVRRLIGSPVLAGWSSLVALTLILDGFLLMMLGLVGEYIGRVYICLNNAPQYVIREQYGETELRKE